MFLPIRVNTYVFVDKYESFGRSESLAVGYCAELKSVPSFASCWWNSIFTPVEMEYGPLGLIHLNPEIFETAYLSSRGFVWTGLPKPLQSSF